MYAIVSKMSYKALTSTSQTICKLTFRCDLTCQIGTFVNIWRNQHVGIYGQTIYTHEGCDTIRGVIDVTNIIQDPVQKG